MTTEPISEITMRWAKRMRKLRSEKGLTQGEVAQALKIDPGTISRQERAEIVPELATQLKLAKFYGVDHAELFNVGLVDWDEESD